MNAKELFYMKSDKNNNKETEDSALAEIAVNVIRIIDESEI